MTEKLVELFEEKPDVDEPATARRRYARAH